MFFIGQSGYIVTLLLTAILPLYMLVAKPGSAHQAMKLTATSPVTDHLIQNHFLKIFAQQELINDIDYQPVIQNEIIPPPARNLKKRAFRNLCIFVAPPLLKTTNKAPPSA